MRVRYDKNQPQVEAERRGKRTRAAATEGQRARRKAPDVHKPHRLPTSHQGRRLSASKREERERRQAAVRLKRSAVVVAIAALVVAAMWGILAFTGSESFRVTSIRVEGTRHLNPSAVEALAAIPKDVSIFGLDRDKIARRIETDPWVAKVKVSRLFPHTAVVRITERVPAGAVDVGGSELWIVSRDGYWLGKRGVEDSSTVVIRDLEEVVPEPGKKVRSKVLANAIAITSRLSSGMLSRIRLVSAPTIEKTALVTNDGIQIYIGEAERVETKEKIARAILQKEKGRVVYINVRVVESPTWRGLSE